MHTKQERTAVSFCGFYFYINLHVFGMVAFNNFKIYTLFTGKTTFVVHGYNIHVQFTSNTKEPSVSPILQNWYTHSYCTEIQEHRQQMYIYSTLLVFKSFRKFEHVTTGHTPVRQSETENTLTIVNDSDLNTSLDTKVFVC